MTKITCNTQRLSVVTSSLMGIIFGGAIVYIITRMVAVQRRVCYLEQHIVKKADEEVVDMLSSKIQTIQTSTQTVLSGLAQGIDTVINPTPSPPPTPQMCPVPVESRAEEMKVPIPDSRIPTLEPRVLPTPNPPAQKREEVMELPSGDLGGKVHEQREAPLPGADVEEVVYPQSTPPEPIDVDNGDFSEVPVKIEDDEPVKKSRRGRPRRK